MIEDLAVSVAEYYGKKNNPFIKKINGGIDGATISVLSKEILAIVKKHCNVVTAAGLADAIPGGATVAVAAIVASTWKMYYDINKCLGISFSENFCKSVASGVVSNLASTGVGIAGNAASNLLSFIPIIGNVAAAAGGIASNRASIHAAAISYLKILNYVAQHGGNLTESSIKSAMNKVK